MELRAQGGRPVVRRVSDGTLVEIEGGRDRLPPDLAASLREWAEVVEAVCAHEEPGNRALVSERGRRLAHRLARATRSRVRYVDPLVDRVVLVSAPAGTFAPTLAEPVPWATGLTASTLTGGPVAVGLSWLFLDLLTDNPFALLVANLVVVGGLAPAVLLLSRRAVWRWVAYGVAGGVLVSWFILVVSLLGPR
ncbi:DUF2537 domain-containing protein [Actinoalloteichus spitiensis]|uniref:DUF2537 domain-containing protein n=1 Tax=Actinoalloteichus spitiensis TaxID=252394 RepID=UPI0012F6E13D|nr:DUF2537 domain-containing protein [Actinoalloteichus spitiensis]